MSVAFTREPDVELVSELPDRSISHHRNLVTATGLARIEAEVERLQHEWARVHEKPASEKSAEEKAEEARTARDLRYWTARRSTAELVPPMSATDSVHFGSAVTIVRGDGRRQEFRIVGEDEADPSKGLISYVSPLAVALMGRKPGETTSVSGAEVDIEGIA